VIKIVIGILLGVVVLVGAVATLISLIMNIDMKGNNEDDDNIFKP